MESYFTERSKLFNEGSEFSCPDSCERYGCKEPNLHVSISLVDLAAISLTSGQKILDLFKTEMKGWTDRMAMTTHRSTPRIAYQFDGNKLLPIHLCK